MSDSEMDRDIRNRVSGLGEVTPLVKATLIGVDSNDLVGSRQVDLDDNLTNAFSSKGTVEPPYDPEMLCLLHEHSNSLRQNVDAYATNIDSFGHRFDPIFNFEDDDAPERLTDEARRAGVDESPESLAERLPIEMRDEKAKLEQFFKFAVHDMSFVTLRKLTRQDLEIIGNAYWEVIRTVDGQISHFVYVPAFTMRLLPLDGVGVEVDEEARCSPLGVTTRKVTKRFRRFVQFVEHRFAQFKEFGDPRIVSAKTGAVFKSMDDMKRAEDTEEEPARPATEILHFKIHSPRSSYGVPRWIGNLLSVLGSRQTEEINFLYFENKSIPPLAILVSGGRIAGDSVAKIRDFVENHIKGKRNFHKIMIIEAEPAVGTSISNEASSRVKIELKPLLGAQHNDALFQKYDQTNRDKIGEAFRIPRLLRGDMRDFNRSTAHSALTFAEQQVFEPERTEFDFIMNRKILPALDAKFHNFVSLAPITRDPVAMSEIVKNLSNANILVPEETRELAGDIFNRSFKKVKSFWARQPAAFTLAGFDFTRDRQSTATPSAPQPSDKFGALSQLASVLVSLRRQMRTEAEKEDTSEFDRAHAAVNGDSDDGVEVIRVSSDTMDEFIDRDQTNP